MTGRRLVRGSLALGALASLAGSLFTVSPANAAPVPAVADDAAELTWGVCPGGLGVEFGLECTTVTVPLDYSNPDGATIDIAVSRLASTNPAERRGVLLTNPGGPGGSGLSMPVDLVSLGMPTSVLDRYDVIGFDPRGIGYSAPVSCGFTVEQGYQTNIPPYASNDAEVAAQAAVAEGVAQQCLEHDTEATLRYMTTANTARDMDLIRSALGEEKISYFGVSYGTVLGSAYASLFPNRTDRVVLDSNVGGTALDVTAFRRFGLGAEQRFPDFAKYAAARHETYELGRTPQAVRRGFFELVDRLDREPIQGVDGDLFRLTMFSALYADQSFPQLAQFWQALKRADAAAVRTMVEKKRLPRVPWLGAALAEPHPFDNTLSAQLAVICNDSAWPRDVADYQRNAKIDRARFPLFGGAAANIVPCAFWPEPLEPPVRISDKGPANILLVQNLRDPATPYVGGVLLRKKFGKRARLVSVDQGGHGVYLFDDNPCGLNVTTRYLVDGRLPAKDVLCPASAESGLRLSKEAAERREATLERLRSF
jgi:pimeloyl-ACP methyl ester carboxylesterase